MSESSVLADMPTPSEVYDRLRNYLSSQTVQEVIETFGSRGISLVVKLVSSILVARVLGPSGKGLLSLAVIIGAIGTQFGNFGIHSANTYFASRREDALNRLLGNSLAVAVVCGGFIAVGTLLLFRYFPEFAPVQGTLLLLALTMIPIRLANLLIKNLFLGLQEFHQYNLVEPASEILSVILIVGVVLTGFVAPGTVLITDLVVAMIILLYMGLKLGSKARPDVSREVFCDSISYGLRAYLAAIASFLVLRTDVLMIGYLLDTSATGLYSIASSIIMYIYMFPTSVSTVLFPKMSGMETTTERRQSLMRAIKVIAVITSVIAVVAFFLGGQVVVLLYGNAFRGSIEPFQWLLPALVLLSVNTMFQSYFAAEGLPWIAVVSPLAGAILNIIVNYFLIPDIGITGASIASILSYGLMLVLSIAYAVFGSNSNQDTPHSEQNHR